MRINKRLVSGILALSFLALNMGGVAAAATPAGQGLEISPPLITTDTDPGKTVTFDIKVRNVTKDTVDVNAEIDDFAPVGEQGQSKVLIGQDNQPSPYGFKTWAEPISAVELAAGEQKPVTVTLDVPTNASPGGHYGVVRFSSSAPGTKGSGVALNASVGTLVLMNVSGKVVNKAALVSFYSADSNGKAKGFFNSGPVNFVERVQNQGNSFFRPLGTVRVTNTFGSQVAVLTVNANGGNVLPASIRRFEQQLNKGHLFGHYKATTNITFDGKNISGTTSFWVIPLKQVAIILAVIIIAVVLIRMNTRRAVKKATGSSSNPSPKKKK